MKIPLKFDDYNQSIIYGAGGSEGFNWLKMCFNLFLASASPVLILVCRIGRQGRPDVLRGPGQKKITGPTQSKNNSDDFFYFIFFEFKIKELLFYRTILKNFKKQKKGLF